MIHFLDTPRAVRQERTMQIIEADFSSQVIHAVQPDDEEHKPLCGESSEAAFVADIGRTLKPGWRWCGQCLRAVESK